MIKTIKTMAKQEKERYNVPRKVQDVIPVRRIWPDGIFLVPDLFGAAELSGLRRGDEDHRQQPPYE